MNPGALAEKMIGGCGSIPEMFLQRVPRRYFVKNLLIE
jgi:hypothetical protein